MGRAEGGPPGNERRRLWPPRGHLAEPIGMADNLDAAPHGPCPSCTQGDLISISMSVSGRNLSFSTCHLCEAKWWFREGEAVPLSSVIDLVVQK
jgi:DNA polymerase III alpha subunit (gram-positive type)